MANLFELLSGLKDKVQDKVQDSVLYNRLVGNNTGSGIEIDPVIVDNNGNMDYAGILEAKQKNTPTTLKEKLFGRTMSLDNTKVNQNEDGTYSADLETYSNRRPGLLSDISSGYNENRFNPIAISNLTDNTTQDGRQKGFAYRLGEGLGSLAKLAESPIGRGLLMGGTVLATNGTPLQALTYGTVTAAGNQGNRMKDKVYRNSLIDDYKNSLQTDPNYYKLNETEQNKIIQEVTNSPEYNAENITDEQRQQMLQSALADGLAQKQAAMQEQIDNTVNNITGLRGYLNDDTYKNLISQKQLKDNAAYRNLMLEAQQRNLDENREWRKQQAETSRQQAEWNRENQNRELAYKYAALRQKAEQDKAKNAIDLYNATHKNDKNESGENKSGKNTKDYTDTHIILDNIAQAWEKMPQSKAKQGTSKIVGTGTGLLHLAGAKNNDVTSYMALRKSMASPLARSISGEKGVLTNQDIERAYSMLPSEFDSYEQGITKLKTINKLLNDLEKGQLSAESTKLLDDNGLLPLAGNNPILQGGVSIYAGIPATDSKGRKGLAF